MKFLKKFESDTIEPEVGDFVLIKVNVRKYIKDNKYMGRDAEDVIDYENFINSAIGVVVDIYPLSNDIEVSYKNIPENIEPWFSQRNETGRRLVHDRKKVWLRRFDMKRVVGFGSSKKELKLNIATKNYNL